MNHKMISLVRVCVAVCAALTVPVRAAQEVGSATVVPIQVNGDPATRFSLVVLGDGYTAADMPKFRAHLDKHLNILWSIEPFRSYRNYFNVYAVEIVSAESGITCDPEVRLQRRTPLQLQFGGGCTNINARGVTVPAAAQALVRQYAQRATPNVDQILIIANSDTYGGIGGGLATTTGGNALSPLITPHELGHSLGGLTDEYTYSARGRAGGTYTGAEPNAIHMTLLSEEAMRAEQKKWWRWLGEVSESGGPIGRYEGGSGNTKGIWRPSKHSMMISLGYAFDQISRERMTQRIAERAGLIATSTPVDGPVGRDDVIWVETAHPVFHELAIEWRVDDVVVRNPANDPHLYLAEVRPRPGAKVTVKVVDPTPFVRDPAIRDTALTATRTWTVSDAPATATPAPASQTLAAEITGSTQTARPISGSEVVFVTTTYPRGRVPDVTWRLDGQVVAAAANRRTFALAPRNLPAGKHTLTATVTDPGARPAATPPPASTRTWAVDTTMPSVAYTLSSPVVVSPAPADVRHYFVRDAFTMKLDPTDDQPGYVVAEFRVNGDGWHHYYGWPDAPPGTPFRFTARGTNIKELIYGSLGSEGLSPQPWEAREPGWGTHLIEYRGLDAAGNISPGKAFRVTVMPSPVCTNTITGSHAGDLRVSSSGVTCLNGATVTGGITVDPGASLVAASTRIDGPITARGAATVELIGTTTVGGVNISETTVGLIVFGSTVGGDLTVQNNQIPGPILIAGNTVRGALSCLSNNKVPSHGGTPNTAARGASGQCAPGR